MKNLLGMIVTDFKKLDILTKIIAKYSSQDMNLYVRVPCLAGCTGKAENKMQFNLSRLRNESDRDREKIIRKAVNC